MSDVVNEAVACDLDKHPVDVELSHVPACGVGSWRKHVPLPLLPRRRKKHAGQVRLRVWP